jgi:beta-1,4-mannosyl-glycoprotein beta-1,4-N-acetylglucosaminyltransferase
MIFDCLMFFNELDLLEIRLTELENIVDRWVITEATKTFSGKAKPLIFEQNRSRFARWSARINYIVVDDMPDGGDAWQRERHQRNALLRGIHDSHPEDGIMVSDADELPHPEAVRRWTPQMGICKFEQMFSYYWINCVGGVWYGTRILPYQLLSSLPDLNALRYFDQCPILTGGGWHFSYLGGPSQIVTKIRAFSHQELNREPFTDESYLKQVIAVGIDLFQRQGIKFQISQLDDRFPTSVLANQNLYSHLIFNDGSNPRRA